MFLKVTTRGGVKMNHYPEACSAASVLTRAITDCLLSLPPFRRGVDAGDIALCSATAHAMLVKTAGGLTCAV